MSFDLQQIAWKISLPCGPKIVLLALCDIDNEKLGCFPSLNFIGQKCGLDERSVRRHLSVLVKKGLLKQQFRDGKSTIFHLNVVVFPTPDNLAGGDNLSAHPPQNCPPTPDKIVRPPPTKLSAITSNEPVKEPVKEPVRVSLPPWLPEEQWLEYVQMRNKIKKPLTPYAVNLAIKKLEKLHAEGQNIAEVLDQSTLNDWQGLFAVKGETKPGYQSAADKRQEWLDAITGKKRRESNVIDITDLAGASIAPRMG